MNPESQNSTDLPPRGYIITRDELIGAAALILPCIIPALSQGLQFIAPGISACFLSISGNYRRTLWILAGLFIAGGIGLVLLGMPEEMLILAQGICVAAILVIFTWAGRTAPEALVACSLCLVVLSVTIMFLATGGRPLAVYQQITAQVGQEFDKAVEIYKANAGNGFPPEMEAIMNEMKATMLSYFPGIIGSVFIFLSLVNIHVLSLCGKIRNTCRVLGPEFQLWKMPQWLVWAFIVTGFMALYTDDSISSAGRNAVAAISIFYLVQGFAVMRFFFVAMRTPAYIRWLVYTLLGIQWYGLLAVLFIGLMDNWFDFRKRMEKSGKEAAP